MELADLTIHAKICLQNRATARFCVIPRFWPRWALSWPESGIAVPATLVFWPWLLAAGPRRQENAKHGRSTRDFALYQGFGRAGLCRGRIPA